MVIDYLHYQPPTPSPISLCYYYSWPRCDVQGNWLPSLWPPPLLPPYHCVTTIADQDVIYRVIHYLHYANPSFLQQPCVTTVADHSVLYRIITPFIQEVQNHLLTFTVLTPVSPIWCHTVIQQASLPRIFLILIFIPKKLMMFSNYINITFVSGSKGKFHNWLSILLQRKIGCEPESLGLI